MTMNEREYYIADGEDLTKANAFMEERQRTSDKITEIAKKYGGEAVINGRVIIGLTLPEKPEGWTEKGTIEGKPFYMPKRTTKALKAIHEDLRSVTMKSAPEFHDLFCKDGGYRCCVSDGSRVAGETEGFDPKDDSAVGVAETPKPDPSPEETRLVERLLKIAKQPNCYRVAFIGELCVDAASLIQRLLKERDETVSERDEYKQRFEWNFDRRHAAENEARLKGEAVVQMQYRLDAMEKQMEAAEAGHRMQTRATLGFRQDWLNEKAKAQSLEAENASLKEGNERLKSLCTEGQWETVESEQAWKRRAEAAEARYPAFQTALKMMQDRAEAAEKDADAWKGLYNEVAALNQDQRRDLQSLEAQIVSLKEALEALLDFPGGMYAPALERRARAALALTNTQENKKEGR